MPHAVVTALIFAGRACDVDRIYRQLQIEHKATLTQQVTAMTGLPTQLRGP